MSLNLFVGLFLAKIPQECYLLGMPQKAHFVWPRRNRHFENAGFPNTCISIYKMWFLSHALLCLINNIHFGFWQFMIEYHIHIFQTFAYLRNVYIKRICVSLCKNMQSTEILLNVGHLIIGIHVEYMK